MIIFMPLMGRAAFTLHLEGTASYTTYGIDGTVSSSFNGRFSLVTDSSKWKVKYVADEAKTEQQTTFDGKFTYTLYANFPLAPFQVDANSPLSKEVIVTNGQRFLNADIAGVDTSRQPVSLFASAQVAWINLLACGLISSPPPQLIPPWLSVASAEAFSYQTRYEPIADGDCCAQIEFITSQKLWPATKRGSASQADRTDVPKENFVEARFRVLSRTNVQNKCVPLEAEFVRYWYPSGGNKTAKHVRSVIVTKVNKYYLSSERISPPVLSKKTYVSDTRFVTLNAPDFLVHYALTNQTWVDKDDPRLICWVEQSRTNYLRMKARFNDVTRKSEASRRLILIVLAFVMLGPVVIVLSRKSNINHKIKQ
jgi:hypothetical protein